MASVDECVRDLYREFEMFRAPDVVSGCLCCHDESALKHLTRTPLWKIDSEVLAEYCFSVYNTVDPHGFPYFLPRILECCVHEDGFGTDLGLVGEKIHEWSGGTEKQRAAMDALFQARWDELILESGPLAARICADWLCLVGNCTDDPRYYLESLAGQPTLFLEFYEKEIVNVNKKGKLTDAFWRSSSPFHEATVRWLQSDKTTERIAEIYQAKYQ